MENIFINGYSCICNIGDNIEEIFKNLIDLNDGFLKKREDIIKGSSLYFGTVNTKLPYIKDERYNLRCNRLLLHCLFQIEDKIKEIIQKYDKRKIGIIIGTTNSGINEFEISNNIFHTEISNPAGFLKNYLNLKGIYLGTSSACTSGIKALIEAVNLINKGIMDCAITGGADALSYMPSYGFNSLELLSDKKAIPFSKNRNGINLSEGAALFILEKEKCDDSFIIKGFGETTDAYHFSTPDPCGYEAARAMNLALNLADLTPDKIDYINLHGTGTISNDLAEANAIKKVFQNNIKLSSTKGLTGDALGASSAIESAFCLSLLDKKVNKNNFLLPHKFDNIYDDNLPLINLVKKGDKKENINYVMNNAIGFGGTNASIIFGR